MLLWESLGKKVSAPQAPHHGEEVKPTVVKRAVRGQRLPYDTRCCAAARSGRRCRARIVEGSDYCAFHDPDVSAERRRLNAAKGGRSKRRLAHLPSGYLKKITTREGLGQAMDQLYREVRVGLITPEMGRVLLAILNRVADAGLLRDVAPGDPLKRTKAARLRPKLEQLLNRDEVAAWSKAVAAAPPNVQRGEPATQAPAANGPSAGTVAARLPAAS